MGYNIEICSKEDCSIAEKGRILKDLVEIVLEIQRFEIVKIDRVTGTEIDILAKNKSDNSQILVECKAWDSTLPADVNVISNLLGNVALRNVSAGWLMTTGSLTQDAEEIRIEWEGRTDDMRTKLSFYTVDRLIDLFLSTKVIVPTQVIKERIKDTFITSDNVILMITDIGKYWLIPVIDKGAGFSTSITVFNAQNGNRIDDKSLLEKLRIRKNSYSDYEWLAGETSDNKIISKLMDEYNNIVPVISGDDWADYRPARPEDFVGRLTLLNDVFSFFDNVIHGTSATRLFSVKAPSGMGKSSIILKISSMAHSRRKSKSYFVYAVDVRTAMSTRYAELALKSCFEAADASGFTDIGSRELETTSISRFFQNESVVKTLSYLKKEKKLIILIFDQFEELFSKKELFGLFDSIRLLSNLLDAQKHNFVLGFAWKTDLSIPAEHPAYYMWSNLVDRRREFDVLQFKESEIKSAIGVFSKQLGEKVNPVLGNYLAKQCQGYPWLLKKLCIHVYNLITEGGTQEAVIGKKLNIVDLFERDLSQLTTGENSCVSSIAKDTPADFFNIADIYGREVVQSLINRRIVIPRASKLILYWDIFRDYVINKTIPRIVSDYIPQQQFSSIAKLIATLIESGNVTTLELSQITGFNANTIDNLMIDSVMFGVAKRENGIISLVSNKEEEIINILQSFFKNHILYIQLQEQVKDGGNYTFFFELFSSVYEHSKISAKTRMTYCSKMYNWFLRLGLISEKEGKFYISTIKETKILLKGTEKSRRRNKYSVSESNLFWGQSSPDKLIETVNKLETGSNSYKSLKAEGLRNALEILSVSQAIRRDGDEISPTKSLDEIMKFISCSPTISFTKTELDKNQNLKSQALGELLNTNFSRNWSTASRKRYGGALLLWTKYFIHSNKC